ncbi:MAG: MFS transporter [Chloroflexi bacterium]|nr:MFS transporter [Chloroflexota bacterium]
MAQITPVEKKEHKARRAWYFYDFGNSAYAAVVLLAVYSAYFKNAVVGGAEGTRLWGVSVGIAAIIVAVISPVLGTIADFSRAKKRLLFFFTALSVVFTGLLFFVGKGDIVTGILFFILAEIGYRGAQVFYDALLVDVSTPETIGSVSGKGWAIGSLGGVLCLVIVLVMIQVFHIDVRYSFLVTALFFLLSALPTFLWVKQVNEPEKVPAGESTFGLAFKKLAQTFRVIKNYKEFAKYMVAFLIYNDGIMMLMDFAAIIGATLFGMNQTQLIIFVIIIQMTGAGGALLFGKISDRVSSKDSIIVSLLILMASITALFFIKSLVLFFIVGAFAGFSLSGAQAVSRSMVSQLAPVNKTAEFYGFLSVAGRTSTFIGPLVFGTIQFRAHNWYTNHGFDPAIAENKGLMWGIGSILAFLIIGMLLLFLVRKVTFKNPLKFES